MKLRICGLLAIAAFVSYLLGSAQTYAQNAYITNFGSNTVSVIDRVTNTVIATIRGVPGPWGVAVSQDGKVYITNLNSSTVSVIDTVTNTVTATIPVGALPYGVAVTPDCSKIYVTNAFEPTAGTQPYRGEPLFMCRVSDTGPLMIDPPVLRAGVRKPSGNEPAEGGVGGLLSMGIRSSRRRGRRHGCRAFGEAEYSGWHKLLAARRSSRPTKLLLVASPQPIVWAALLYPAWRPGGLFFVAENAGGSP